MLYWIICGTLAVAGIAGIFAVGSGFSSRLGQEPDTIERRGAFEIVTRHRSDDFYMVRHQGKPFSIQGKAGMYGDDTATYEWMNAVITFDDTTPAFVVDVGDPNNTSFFYLVREVNGAAEASYLGESHGGVSADWLDPPTPARRESTRDITLHRGRLGGGRWLLLGDWTLLDTRTLTARSMAQPEGIWMQPFASPLLLSPDERSFVRLGSVSDNEPVLAVLDFEEGSCATLPIDRRTMRYDDWSEIDAAWVLHHFEWARDAAGRDRLQQRTDWKPLPFRGKLTVEDDGYREYRLPTSRRALYDELVDFIVRAFEATPDSAAADTEARELIVGGKTVNVSFYSQQPSVWMSRGENSRLVAEIARRFDQKLATGKYDSQFAPPDSTEE